MLSQAEKLIIVQYLRHEADSNDQLIEQMEKLPGASELVRRYKIESSAARIVLAKLLSGEEVTI